MKRSKFWMYKNTEPMNRGCLAQEEMDTLLQVLHNHNATLDESKAPKGWFSLLAKIEGWER
jgi:hypothetical protein